MHRGPSEHNHTPGYTGIHRKPKRKWFYKPDNWWEWFEQAVQLMFVIVAGSFLILLLIGAIKGI